MPGCKKKMAIKIEAIKTLDDLNHDGLILGFFSDERPPRGHCGFADWRLNGMISKQIFDGNLAGSNFEKVLIAADRRLPSSKILLIGLGLIAELSYDILYSAGYAFAGNVENLKWDDFAFEIPGTGRCNLEMPIMTEAVLTGFFDAFSKNIANLEVLNPVLLIGQEMMEPVLDGVERFKKNIKGVIPVEMEKV